MDQQVTVVYIKNQLDPFRSREIFRREAGLTLREYCEEICGEGIRHYDIVASVNGCEFLPGKQYEYVVRPGDALAFTAVPQGSKDGKAIFSIVAMVAIMVFAPYAGGAASSAFQSAYWGSSSVVSLSTMSAIGTIGYAAGYGAVLMAGGLLLSALTPKPAGPDASSDTMESATYSWDVAANRIIEGGSLPELFGTCVVKPPLIGKFVDGDGDLQYLNLLYAIVGHRIDSNDQAKVTINDLDAMDFSGISLETHALGRDTQGVCQMFGDTVADTQVSLPLPSFSITGATKANPCVITAPGHTFIAGDKIHIANVAGMTQLNGKDFTVGVVNGDMFQLSGISATAYSTYTSGGYAAKWVERQTSAGIDEIRFGIGLPNGLYYANDNGGLDEQTVNVACQYKLTSSGTWTPVPYYSEGDGTILVARWSRGYFAAKTFGKGTEWFEVEAGSTASGDHSEGDDAGVYTYTVEVPYDDGVEIRTYRRATTWSWKAISATYKKGTLVSSSYVPIQAATTRPIHRIFSNGDATRGQYDIRVRRANALPTTTRYGHKTVWEYFQEVIHDDLMYPGVALLAVRALGTDQLSDGMPIVKCKPARNYVKVWTGAAYEDKPANNPAWACYHLLHRGKVNDDGTVSCCGVQHSKIDYASFSAWASYCTMKGYTVNIYFDTPRNLRQQLNTVGLLGRGIPIQMGSRWYAFVDKADASVQRFSFGMGNIVKDSYREEYIPYEDRANAVEVTYYDADTGDPTTVELYADGFDTSDREIVKAAVNLVGCTDRAQAFAYGKWLLNQNRYLSLVASWEAGVDAVACLPFDVVEVSHDVPQYGYSGRVVSATSNSVTLDREVTVGAGTHKISVRHQDNDSVEEVTVANGAGTYSTLNIVGSWAKVPAKFANYAFGPSGAVSKKFRVVSIARTQELTYRITGIEYNANIYDESVTVPHEPSPSNLPKVKNLRAYEVWSGGLTSDVTLLWEGAAVRWKVWHRAGAGAYVYDGETVSPSFVVRGLSYGQTYTFAVSGGDSIVGADTVALALVGKPSGPADGIPGDVAFIDAQCSFTDKVYLAWTPSGDLNLAGYEVRTDTSWGTAAGLLYRGIGTTLVWNAYAVSPTMTSYTIYIKAVDVAGSYSATEDLVTVTVPTPAAPSGVTVEGSYGKVRVSWDEISDPIVTGVEIWRSSTNNRTAAAKVGEIAGTAFVDTFSIFGGSTYYYWLRAVTMWGTYSAWSAAQGAGHAGTVPLITTADLADAAISKMKLAPDIVTPEVVNSLPVLPDPAYPEGKIVYLTTDGKLYRNDQNSGGPSSTQDADNFNRANENPLSDAGKWILCTGMDDNLKVVSNQCVADGAGTLDRRTYRNRNLTNDQYARIKVVPDLSNDMNLSVHLRLAANGNGYGLGISRTTEYGWSCGLFVETPDYAQVGTWKNVSITASDVIEVRIVGTTLSWYKNGSLQNSATVSGRNSGFAGLGFWQPYGAIDDFECGDYPIVESSGGVGWNATVAGEDVVDLLITHEQITDQLVAGQIAAGAVGANEIAANSVAVKHLVVADYTNAVVNPIFAGGDSSHWVLSAGVESVIARGTAGVPSGAPTEYVNKAPAGAWGSCPQGGTEFIDCSPGEEYFISVECASDANVDGGLIVGAQWTDKDGVYITNLNANVRYGASAAWEKLGGIVVAPVGARRFVFLFVVTGTSGNWYFTQARVRKAAGGELIVDGAITADKLTTNHLTAQNTESAVFQQGYQAPSDNNTAPGTGLKITGGKIEAYGDSHAFGGPVVSSDGNFLVSLGKALLAAGKSKRYPLQNSTNFMADGQLHVYRWTGATWQELCNLGSHVGTGDSYAGFFYNPAYVGVRAEGATNGVEGKGGSGYGGVFTGTSGVSGTTQTAGGVGGRLVAGNPSAVDGGDCCVDLDILFDPSQGPRVKHGQLRIKPASNGVLASPYPSHVAPVGTVWVGTRYSFVAGQHLLDGVYPFIAVGAAGGYGSWRTIGCIPQNLTSYALADGSMCCYLNPAPVVYIRVNGVWRGEELH